MVFFKNYKFITSKSFQSLITNSIRSLLTANIKNGGLNKLSIEKLDLKDKRILMR